MHHILTFDIVLWHCFFWHASKVVESIANDILDYVLLEKYANFWHNF